MREMVRPSLDRKIFSHSARRTKSVNLGARILRGGIRF